MKAMISSARLPMLLAALSILSPMPASADAVLDAEVRLADKDRNGYIDGRDWVKMSPSGKQRYLTVFMAFFTASHGMTGPDTRAKIIKLVPAFTEKLNDYYSVRSNLLVKPGDAIEEILAQ